MLKIIGLYRNKDFVMGENKRNCCIRGADFFSNCLTNSYHYYEILFYIEENDLSRDEDSS